MNATAKSLDATYRRRALPQGSARFWSHWFAAPQARPALLGVHALLAEWLALVDPALELGVAQMKLAWWQQELLRLAAGSPLHPIGAYLASLPGASTQAFEALLPTLAAALTEISGAPLERGTDLAPHAEALLGIPWRVASRLAGEADDGALAPCTRALSVADYLARSLSEYRRDAAHGRVPFAVDELLAAGIDNAALAEPAAGRALQNYLARLREHADAEYLQASSALPRDRRHGSRHLLVAAAVGRAHLGRQPGSRARPLKDMLLAWNTARRAQA